MRFIGWILSGIIYFLALIAIVSIVIFFSINQTTRSGLMDAIQGPYADGRDSSWHSAAGKELVRANSDHWNIAYQISRCFNGVDLSNGVPGTLAVAFLIGTQPSGELTWGDTPAGTPTVKLTNYQRTVLVLSQSIVSMRAQSSASSAKNQSVMYTLQWLIVLLGAATTIFVSIKSISSSNSRGYQIIGILAIIFSAASTASSSINSFLGSADAYIKFERTLHQARAGHWDLALLASQDTKICEEFDSNSPEDTRAKKISDISSRMREILASSSSGGGIPSSGASNNSSSPLSSSKSGG